MSAVLKQNINLMHISWVGEGVVDQYQWINHYLMSQPPAEISGFRKWLMKTHHDLQKEAEFLLP